MNQIVVKSLFFLALVLSFTLQVSAEYVVLFPLSGGSVGDKFKSVIKSNESDMAKTSVEVKIKGDNLDEEQLYEKYAVQDSFKEDTVAAFVLPEKELTYDAGLYTLKYLFEKTIETDGLTKYETSVVDVPFTHYKGSSTSTATTTNSVTSTTNGESNGTVTPTPTTDISASYSDVTTKIYTVTRKSKCNSSSKTSSKVYITSVTTITSASSTHTTTSTVFHGSATPSSSCSSSVLTNSQGVPTATVCSDELTSGSDIVAIGKPLMLTTILGFVLAVASFAV